MAKLKWNLKGVERGGSFKYPPPGLYTGKIVQIDEGESKSGNEMLTVHIKMLKGNKAGKGIKMRTWILTDNEASMWKLAEFLDACGVTKGGKKETGSVDVQKLVGTQLSVKVDPDTDQNDNPSSKIGQLSALPDDDDDEEEDEDEDGSDDEDESDEDEDEESEEEDDEEDDEEEEVDYSEMSFAELKAEAKERGIKLKKGIKSPGIIKLLEANDEEDDDPFDGDDD